jgi:hypothetical protein
LNDVQRFLNGSLLGFKDAQLLGELDSGQLTGDCDSSDVRRTKAESGPTTTSD